MMENTKMSNAEALKMEIMERYGLREDQVRLELNISTTDLDLGRQILADFDSAPEDKELLPEGINCDCVRGTTISSVWVHRKDGFYGWYLGEEGADENDDN